MAITKPRARSAEAFVRAAPDAVRKGVQKGKKEQISLTIMPDMLAKIDDYAAQRGQTRAATINMAIFEFLRRGGEAGGRN